MTIFTVCNTKGGVGKTTLTTHEAILLSKTHSVLVIDLDDQANTTNSFVSSDDFPFPSSAMGIFDESLPITPMIGNYNVNIIPSHPSLSDIEHRNTLTVCRTAKRQIRSIAKDFDIVLIDTPGSFSERLGAALSASDFSLIPMELDNYNIEALQKLVALFTDVTETTNPMLAVAGLIPTSVKGINDDGLPIRNTQRSAYIKLKQQFNELIWPIIRERESIARAQLDRNSLFEQKPLDEKAINDFERIASMIINLVEIKQ